MEEIIGTFPLSRASSIESTSTPVISPTKPRSGSESSFTHCRTSLPGRRSASQSFSSTKAATSPFTLRFNTSSTISIVRESVTRSPSTKSDSIPRSFIVRVIALPPPCTTTTRMPTEFRKTISLATRERVSGSGASMKLPPYLTTKVEPRKCRT